MSDLNNPQFRAKYDAQADFGFVGDLRGVFDGVTTGGTNTITSATMALTAADIGKRITLAGAGAAGAMYAGTILTQGGTTCTVSPNTTTSVSGRGLQIGTDNTAAITLMQNTVNNLVFPGVVIDFSSSETNAYGFPIAVDFTKTAIIKGIGRAHNADTGDYLQAGGTRLAWWGVTSGSLFGGFWTFRPTGAQNIKGTGFRDCWMDCRNGDQAGANALYAVKLASVNGMSFDNFFIMDPGAIGIWCDIDATPTEQESTSRGIIQNVNLRCLDSPPSSMTAPILMTSAVTLTTTPQNLTVAANTLISAGYFWTMTTTGRPVLVNYTGGGGTTTLTGCTVSPEDNILVPVTVNGGNVVQAVPGNSAAAVLSGNLTANTNLSIFSMWAISHGTTWGPAAIECANADSIVFDQVVINGGSATNDGAINRIRKPGVRFNGHATSLSLAARNNAFREGDAGAGGVSNMALLNTGAKMTAPAGPNFWWGYQLGNGAPQPTIELGGYLDWTANGGVVGGIRNVNNTLQTIAAATLTSVSGSVMLLPPQAFQIGTTFKWTVHLDKTAAGTAARTFHIRVGANGTTADAIVMTFTSGVPTAVAGSGFIEILYTITTLGGGSANGVGSSQLIHAGTTPIVGLAAAPNPFIAGTPAAFSSPVSGLQYIGLTLTTGAAEVINNRYAVAEIVRIGSQGA